MKLIIFFIFIFYGLNLWAQQSYVYRTAHFEKYLAQNQICYELNQICQTNIKNLIIRAQNEEFGDIKKKKLFLDKALEILSDDHYSKDLRLFLPLRILYSVYSKEFEPSEYNIKLLLDILSGSKIKINRNSLVKEVHINQHHPVWHSDHIKRDTWIELEDQYNQSMSLILDKQYNLKTAHKVLFINKIKDTATNPKITTKDAYGVKWKLKWGREVYTEPIANRLYLKLGGKMTDLVYAQRSGSKGVTLILADKKTKGSCKHINTEEL